VSCIHLHLDFETRSRLDIREVGLDNYAQSAEVLMLAYAFGDAPPSLWFPHEGPLPDALWLLARPEVIKVAWNSAFERAIFKHALGIDIPIRQWLDPAARARYALGTASLAQTCDVLGLAEEEGKLASGKKLMRLFSFPVKTKKRLGQFNDWTTHPAQWAEFAEYCRRDVVAERAVLHKLAKFPLPLMERRLWALDQEINERGMPVDMAFVTAARRLVDDERARLMAELTDLTGLENPNSVPQLLGWLKGEGYPLGSLGAKKVEAVL